MTTNKVLIGCTIALIAAMALTTALVIGAVQRSEETTRYAINQVDLHTNWVRDQIKDDGAAEREALSDIELRLRQGVPVTIVR
jgi:hypothetical protein